MSYIAVPLTPQSTAYFLASYKSRGTTYKQMFIVQTDSQPAMVTVYKHVGGQPTTVMEFHVEERGMKHVEMDNITNDITGYYLVSSVPVAVFSGHQCANVPVTALYCDPMIQQLLPHTDLGRDYVLGPIMGRSMEVGYTVRIVKTTEDTDVILEHAERQTAMETYYHGSDGQCRGQRLTDSTTAIQRQYCTGRPNIGDFIEVKNNAALLPVAVHCSDPCLVIQYNHGGNMDRSKSDPFMMMALPFSSESNMARFTTFEMLAKGKRLEHENYVNIISRVEDYDGLFLDGQPLQSSNIVVLRPSIGAVRIASMALSHGDHVVEHRDRSVPFLVQLYGHGDSKNPAFTGKTGYGMPIGRGKHI
jgi:uncharacterized protein YcgL (UPF0745 family)